LIGGFNAIRKPDFDQVAAHIIASRTKAAVIVTDGQCDLSYDLACALKGQLEELYYVLVGSRLGYPGNRDFLYWSSATRPPELRSLFRLRPSSSLTTMNP
jgi:hypothetical protein